VTESSPAAVRNAARIVVAEDEAIIRMDLVEMLSEAGYVVVGQAADGETAVSLVRDLRPDLALLDVKMPILDGISAAEQISAENLAAVVLLTAFSDRALVARAAQAGAMGYLVKPIGRADLVPALEVALARHGQMLMLEREVGSLQDQIAARVVVERAKGELMSRLGLSESESFQWLRKRAMDRRLPLVEVARTILDGLQKESGSKDAAVTTPDERRSEQ
jgi:two-component system, response regulator PdtaR